jgi:hypothetical protein
MHQVDLNKTGEWKRLGNYTGMYVPMMIDIGCPHCRRTPVNLPLVNWEVRGDTLYTPARCPACGEISKFWMMGWDGSSPDEVRAQAHLYMYPNPYLGLQVDEEIPLISPAFFDIYEQAARAESLGLDKLCGVGYRKAIEFLIKDWIAYKRPELRPQVEHLFLGKCIKEYVEDPKIKAVAERAVWLGNDETHYVRKWMDKDINDLKTLLRLTVNWIESSLLTDRYIAGMDEGKK